MGEKEASTVIETLPTATCLNHSLIMPNWIFHSPLSHTNSLHFEAKEKKRNFHFLCAPHTHTHDKTGILGLRLTFGHNDFRSSLLEFFLSFSLFRTGYVYK